MWFLWELSDLTVEKLSWKAGGSLTGSVDWNFKNFRFEILFCRQKFHFSSKIFFNENLILTRLFQPKFKSTEKFLFYRKILSNLWRNLYENLIFLPKFSEVSAKIDFVRKFKFLVNHVFIENSNFYQNFI